MKKLTIILDRAHGINVVGKQSPDGKHKEYLWSTMICKMLEDSLKSLGYNVVQTVNDDKEPGLYMRRSRAEVIKADHKLLISMHNNAAGNGSQWMNAEGVEIFTCKGQTKSDEVASTIFDCIRQEFPYVKFRVDMKDGDPDKEENFTVLMGQSYMAVLVEWGFQDDIDDVKFIDNEDNMKRLCKALVRAVEITNSKLN